MEETTKALVETLDESMKAESALFFGLGQAFERLRETFQGKEWGPSLATAEEIQRSAQSIGEADAVRDEAFISLREALRLPRESAFSAILPILPDAERELLETSWRALRMAVVRLKIETGRMRYSAEALSQTLNRILDEAFPYRKGKIYSRRGKPTSVSGALLVDRKQ
jgi:hypothetical protein